MGRKRLSSDLFVYMNNKKVGVLSKISAGVLQFVYDKTWLQSKYGRPISLSMPMQEAPYAGEVVYNYFDNLLPDNDSIRKRIQKRFEIEANHCFDILSYIGADCVGALQLLSEPLAEMKPPTIEAKPVSSQQMVSILKNYRMAPLGMSSDSDFRISIAGAQEKTAFLRYNGKWCAPSGATPTTHIFKLPIGRIEHAGIDLSDSVENEWLCLKILSAWGFEVNEATIIKFGEMKVLACERFDRKWNRDKSDLLRLPQEDMCQVFGVASALKYESDGGPGMLQIMSFLNGSIEAYKDREKFFRACIAFWILGAVDGHAKNFSIRIEPAGRYQLTPLYDVLSAYPSTFKNQLGLKKLKMAMSVKGRNKHYHWHSILKRHWIEMAGHVKFSTEIALKVYESLFDTIEAVIDKVSSELPKEFPPQIADAIFNGMRVVRNAKN